jgi:hypothetical protein
MDAQSELVCSVGRQDGKLSIIQLSNKKQTPMHIQKLKKYILLFMIVCIVCITFAQSEDARLENILRFNIINPGIEYEFPVCKCAKSLIATNMGWGYGMPYPGLYEPGYYDFVYMFMPFINISYKKMYNRDKRQHKNKYIGHNTGNYWGLRFLYRGTETISNVSRTDTKDFAVGPVWGLQRSSDQGHHFLFDIGMIYYFDSQNSGIIMPVFQFSIGFNVLKN